MVKLTALIGIIGAIQTIVFAVQAGRLKETILKMKEIAKGQTEDMKASIREATRASVGMEGVATSMATSTGINREIADRQKLVAELSGRAYLSASLNYAMFQDTKHFFEVSAILTNRGSTPAYDVTFRVDADIVAWPIPDNFDFPLPANTAGISVSLIGPGLTKIVTKTILTKVPDNEIAEIKRGGPPKCFLMRGIVNYLDAFKEPRYLKFAFKVHWMGWVEGMDKDKDGNPKPEKVMSEDTSRHNEAN